MVDTLLRSLRDRVIDENEPLAGLLRKCLLLGAETRSDSLRQWARFELNGYGDDVEIVPAHRQIPTPPIFLDYVSGYTFATNQMLDRMELPAKAREYVSESLAFRQPVEELERLATQKSFGFATTGLAVAKYFMNQETGPFQQVVGLRFKMQGSVVAGILGQIRTRLVDLIADLSADTPLTELPGKEQVDAAVGHRIGTQYNTTIHTASGATAIGTRATAVIEQGVPADLLALIEEARKAAQQLEDERQEELLDAIECLRAEASKATGADTGEMVKRAGRVRQLAQRIGVPSLVAAVGGAVEAAVGIAMAGGFG